MMSFKKSLIANDEHVCVTWCILKVFYQPVFPIFQSRYLVIQADITALCLVAASFSFVVQLQPILTHSLRFPKEWLHFISVWNCLTRKRSHTGYHVVWNLQPNPMMWFVLPSAIDCWTRNSFWQPIKSASLVVNHADRLLTQFVDFNWHFGNIFQLSDILRNAKHFATLTFLGISDICLFVTLSTLPVV